LENYEFIKKKSFHINKTNHFSKNSIYHLKYNFNQYSNNTYTFRKKLELKKFKFKFKFFEKELTIDNKKDKFDEIPKIK